VVNIAYKDLQDYFAAKDLIRKPADGGAGNAVHPTLAQVRQAVIDVRWKKLPDWKLWGTAGSYFKNPVIDAARFESLKKRYPGLPGFPESDGRVKVSLGWILDKVCDVRGLRMGKASVYEKQALVLVAEPGATAEEVVNLSRELMKRVRNKTGIEIEGEVEWVN
jgi:UDP-N-acetylmuramate dehydrogenase